MPCYALIDHWITEYKQKHYLLLFWEINKD